MNFVFNSKLWRAVILLSLLKTFAAESTSEHHVSKRNNTLTWVEKLRHDLLTNYDKYIRPAKNDDKIHINIHLEISHIELDSTTGLFTLYGRLHTDWKDSKLIWEKNDYGNLELLPVSDHEIWLPDLMLYNSALKNSAEYYGSAQCYIKSTGEVSWIPYVRYQLFCDMDPRLWPFDSHMCPLVIGSWTFSEWQIDLKLNERNESVINLFVKNSEWKVTNVSAERTSKFYSCCEAPYVSVTYNVSIQRRSAMYKAIVYTPTISVILTTLACFWLPPQSGEKITLNGINLIIVLMFMKFFAEKLPALSRSTPLIVSFYCNTLLLIGFSMIVSVTVITISKSKHSRQVPVNIRKLLKGCFGQILGVAHLKSRVEESELKEQHLNVSRETESSSLTEEFYQSDWISLASAIDRIAFIIYCFGFGLITIIAYS